MTWKWVRELFIGPPFAFRGPNHGSVPTYNLADVQQMVAMVKTQIDWDGTISFKYSSNPPSNIQDLYIKSLEPWVLIPTTFDLWKTTGNRDTRAWGLGWEVWLDGMEITQFTYFNSVVVSALSHR